MVQSKTKRKHKKKGTNSKTKKLIYGGVKLFEEGFLFNLEIITEKQVEAAQKSILKMDTYNEIDDALKLINTKKGITNITKIKLLLDERTLVLLENKQIRILTRRMSDSLPKSKYYVDAKSTGATPVAPLSQLTNRVLPNVGNTCYMSASLQLLFDIDEFRTSITSDKFLETLSEEPISEDVNKNKKRARAMHNLFKDMTSSTSLDKEQTCSIIKCTPRNDEESAGEFITECIFKNPYLVTEELKNALSINGIGQHGYTKGLRTPQLCIESNAIGIYLGEPENEGVSLKEKVEETFKNRDKFELPLNNKYILLRSERVSSKGRVNTSINVEPEIKIERGILDSPYNRIYQLVGFIEHIETGRHYVYYGRKVDKWLLYNDLSKTIDEQQPTFIEEKLKAYKDGTVYLYKRTDHKKDEVSDELLEPRFDKDVIVKEFIKDFKYSKDNILYLKPEDIKLAIDNNMETYRNSTIKEDDKQYLITFLEALKLCYEAGKANKDATGNIRTIEYVQSVDGKSAYERFSTELDNDVYNPVITVYQTNRLQYKEPDLLVNVKKLIAAKKLPRNFTDSMSKAMDTPPLPAGKIAPTPAASTLPPPPSAPHPAPASTSPTATPSSTAAPPPATPPAPPSTAPPPHSSTASTSAPLSSPASIPVVPTPPPVTSAPASALILSEMGVLIEDPEPKSSAFIKKLEEILNKQYNKSTKPAIPKILLGEIRDIFNRKYDSNPAPIVTTTPLAPLPKTLLGEIGDIFNRKYEANKPEANQLSEIEYILNQKYGTEMSIVPLTLLTYKSGDLPIAPNAEISDEQVLAIQFELTKGAGNFKWCTATKSSSGEFVFTGISEEMAKTISVDNAIYILPAGVFGNSTPDKYDEFINYYKTIYAKLMSDSISDEYLSSLSSMPNDQLSDILGKKTGIKLPV